MSNNKNFDRKSYQADSLNNHLLSKSLFNPEANNSIKQDLLYFKNDVLKDIRRLEEKINIKLTEQTVVNNEQYEAYEKKLDSLSTKIIQVNTIISDNTLLTEKINNFQTFKSKAEDNLLALNSRIFNIQKESKDATLNLENTIEENLKYPGIIGKNCRFSNFRFFIDFILSNFKTLNSFKDEIQNYDFAEFKRKVSNDLQECRYAVSENYQNSRRLLENNIKEFNKKLTEFNNLYEKKFENYDDTIKDFKNKINDYLFIYEQKLEEKFNTLENTWNDKFTEQLNEINNLKNKFINDINNIKNSISKNNKSIEYLKKTIEKNILLTKMNNTNYRKPLFEKKKDSRYPLAMTNNDNNQILDNNMLNSDEKSNLEHSLVYYTNMRMKQLNIIEHSKSFDKSNNNEISLKNYYSEDQLRNTKESMAFTQDEFNNDGKRFSNLIKFNLKKSIPKMYLNKYNNCKKVVFQNNYSITNIPNIKIKKVVLPENINNRNKIIKISKTTLMKNKGKRVMSNNPSIPKKYFLQNSDNFSMNKNMLNNFNNFNYYNAPKINKNQNSKRKNINFVESAKIIGRRPLSKRPKNINLLSQIQAKNKNDIFDSAGELKKNKTRSLSFEKNKKEKNEKDEKIQIGFRKTFIANNQVQELLLINARNLKKSRKIKM